MFNFLNKKNPPTRTFVGLSLLLLFIFILLLFYFMADSVKNNTRDQNLNAVKIDDFNPVDSSSDPYITYLKNQDSTIVKPSIDKYDPKYGSSDAKLNIVYFGDYTCSYCLKQIGMIKNVVDTNEDINLIWKDYPEDDIDTNSWQAALAGRCAQSQNKFWEFLDLYSSQYSTFSTQSGLSKEEFNNFIIGLAKANDLNMNKFKSCYNNLEHSDVLARSVAEAKALKLPGVPYTYIGDREVLGEFEQELLIDEIDRVLNRE